MRKSLLISLLALTLLVALPLFAEHKVFVKSAIQQNTQPSEQLYTSRDVLAEVYFQDFENGWGDWIVRDATVPWSVWHSSDFITIDGDALWLGAEQINGYEDKIYVIMETPMIDVPAGNSTLTFDLNFWIENIGTAADHSDSPEYNGWDGINISVSTDDSTWTVVSGYPAYNSSSSWGFGHHLDTPNIPAWGGTTNSTADANDYDIIPEATNDGWVDASFDLSAYEGESVKIRFSFASDTNGSTSGDQNLFGAAIDNISLGTYTNNGDDTDLTIASMVPEAGNYWNIEEPTMDCPSPTHAAVNRDGASYAPGLTNFIYSPSIQLPTTGDIKVDFKIRGLFDDEEQDDHWTFHVSNDDGLTWNYMSNPYNDPNDTNFVFVDAPEDWSSAVSSYSMDGYLNGFAGQEVKFRIGFETDDDAPDGTGVMIDDFRITTTLFVPTPHSLVSEFDEENHEVELNWHSPFGGGSPGWFFWGNETPTGYFGRTNIGEFDCAQRFDAVSLAPYVGLSIDQLRFRVHSATAELTACIWTGVTADSLLAEVSIGTAPADTFQTVNFPNPVEITESEIFWVGLHVNQTDTLNLPIWYDAGPNEGGFWWKPRNSWVNIYEDDPNNYNQNMMIHTHLIDPNDTERTIWTDSGMNPIREGRSLDNYAIYRKDHSALEYDLLATIATDNPTYTDTDPLNNTINDYVVAAVYTEGTSDYSNVTSEFTPSTTTQIIGYHDDTFEDVVNIQMAEHVAAKFDPHVDSEVANTTLYGVRYHVSQMNGQNLSFFFYGSNDDGLPEGTLASAAMIPNSIIEEGWNLFLLEEPVDITEAQTPFFISHLYITGMPLLSVDTDHNGMCYHKHTVDGNTVWDPYTVGEVAIEGYFEPQVVEATDTNVPKLSYKLSNHPNPFNPNTNISFSVPKKGNVELTIYNVKGQLVKSLFSGNCEAGERTVQWDGTSDNGKNATSGVYFYKLKTKDMTVTRGLTR